MRLQGKIAIVTGAASGIGQAIASLFAQEGASVIMTDKNEILLREAGEKLVAQGAQVMTIFTDVTHSASVQQMVTRVLATYDHIDVLCNSAGIDLKASIEQTSEEAWDQVLTVNLKSAFLTVKAVVPAMRERGGSIINIASGAGLLPIPARPAYCASKGGLILFTKALALDLAPSIRVNAICPGAVETPMFFGGLAQEPDPQVARQAILERYPLRRFAQPEEIAQAALYLASDASTYVTGIALPVDGGRTMH